MKNSKNTKNISQMSKFEATMYACQKAKATALKENTSKVKKIAKPKATATLENKKRTIKSQNKKVESALRRRRMVEDEDYDPEVDDADVDIDAELPEDTASDAVIVVDPELDTDEYEANLDDLQTILDDTPEGEVPSTDEYVGDFVYTCPICGNNFFSDSEMSNEPCPVCGEEVDEFILVGDIQSSEAAEGEDDIEDTEGDIEDLEDDIKDVSDEDEEPVDEELDIDVSEDDIADECLYKDAKCKDEGPAIKKESRRRKMTESASDDDIIDAYYGMNGETGEELDGFGRFTDEVSEYLDELGFDEDMEFEEIWDELSSENKNYIKKLYAKYAKNESRQRSKKRAVKESYKYLIDESTLNPFLSKFIKENYKNATSMKAVGAKILGKTIKIECKIKFKSGATKKTVISLEGFVPSMKKRSFKAKADSVFKVESKKTAPFTFEAFTRGKVIKFTGMNYSFITQKEGKRVQIYGKYALKENKSFRRGIRK